MSGYAEANTSEEPRGEETDLRIGERLIPEPLPPDPRQVWARATNNAQAMRHYAKKACQQVGSDAWQFVKRAAPTAIGVIV